MVSPSCKLAEHTPRNASLCANHPISDMTAFQKEFNPARILLIGNSGLPWQEFLQLNPATLI
jgi:hypothetical protein